MNDLPRGLEVILKKAAIDAGFRERLLQDRARAADLIGLTLEPAEAAMLDAIPRAQLAATVARAEVPPGARAAFLGYAATAMVAALGTVLLSSCSTPAPVTEGTRPDDPTSPDDVTAPTMTETAATADTQPMHGVRPDEAKTTGIRPDVPGDDK